MGKVKPKWVGGQSGHWEFYWGSEFLESCDDAEYSETFWRLRVTYEK